MLALDPDPLQAIGAIASIGFLGFVVGTFVGAVWNATNTRAVNPLDWGQWGAAWAGMMGLVFVLARWAGLH